MVSARKPEYDGRAGTKIAEGVSDLDRLARSGHVHEGAAMRILYDTALIEGGVKAERDMAASDKRDSYWRGYGDGREGRRPDPDGKR